MFSPLTIQVLARLEQRDLERDLELRSRAAALRAIASGRVAALGRPGAHTAEPLTAATLARRRAGLLVVAGGATRTSVTGTTGQQLERCTC